MHRTSEPNFQALGLTDSVDFAVRPLLIHPNPAPVAVGKVLDAAEHGWMAVTDPLELARVTPADGWAGAVVSVAEPGEVGWAICRALRKMDPAVVPIIVLVKGSQMDDLNHRDDLFDDFCMVPLDPRELARRVERALRRDGDAPAQLIVYGELVLNVETYQAMIAGRPLELTHMEYELLRYLAASPGRVFTREVLLSQVWGYDYFGGARTVDVHIRRLRSKLGPDHSTLIQTVRSVGYTLGRSRWPGIPP